MYKYKVVYFYVDLPDMHIKALVLRLLHLLFVYLNDSLTIITDIMLLKTLFLLYFHVLLVFKVYDKYTY